jgi:acetyl esterase
MVAMANQTPASKGPQKRVSPTRSSTSKSPPEPTSVHEPRRGPGQRQGLYNRRLQRTQEHWPLPARVNAWLFRHPESVLAMLGKRSQVQVNGKVLNRSIQAMLEVVNRFQSLVFGRQSSSDAIDPVVMRQQLKRVARMAMPVRTDVHVVGRVIPASESPEGNTGIPVRTYRRFGVGVGVGLGSRPPAILFLHGGGWATGDLDSHDASCRLLASVSRCVVIAVEYRLAPEAPFPAAVDDVLAAYGWVHRHADELGIAPGRVGVFGDSAGGNLAAVIALQTRKGGAGKQVAQGKDADQVGERAAALYAGTPPPVAQGLIYPALSARLDTDSIRTLADGFFLTADSMRLFRSLYLPDPADWERATASPLLADDLSGLAPALVVTAGFDPLHDDGEAYADALAKAGVEVEYRCCDDQVHGFFGMGIIDDSLGLATEICDAMGRMMYRDDG